MKLQGKRILITGGNRGIGLAIARVYAAEGASLMLCGRDAAALQEASDQVSGLLTEGAKVATQATDVSDAEQVQALVEATQRELGGLDVLVANAGVYGPLGPLDCWEGLEDPEAEEFALWNSPCAARTLGGTWKGPTDLRLIDMRRRLVEAQLQTVKPTQVDPAPAAAASIRVQPNQSRYRC